MSKTGQDTRDILLERMGLMEGEEENEEIEECEEEEAEEEEEEEEEKPKPTKKDKSGVQPKESDKITLKETHALAKAVQKGYTLTRQQMAKMVENTEKIQEAVDNIANKGTDDDLGEDEPLTVKGFLKLQKEQQDIQSKEDDKIKSKISDTIDELKAEGIIKNDEDKDSLIKYAIKHKITDLKRAAVQWKELEDAKGGKKSKIKKAKEKARGKEGKKVGTSKKTSKDKGDGVPYDAIRNKSMEDIAEGEE